MDVIKTENFKDINERVKMQPQFGTNNCNECFSNGFTSGLYKEFQEITDNG